MGLAAEEPLVVEEPAGGEREVGEEAVHSQGKVLLQLGIGILQFVKNPPYD